MTWGFIQSNSHAAASVTSVASAYTSGLSSGSKMVAWVSTNGATHGQCTGVSDGLGHSFTKVADTGTTASGFGGLQCWLLDTPAGDVGATPTITASFDAAGGQSILIEEWGSLLAGTTGAVDGTPGTNVNSTGGASGITTGTPAYSTSAVNELLLSAAYSAGNGGGFPTFTPPGGYTLDPHNQSGVSTLAAISVGYKNSTGGAESDGWSINATGGTFQAWAVIMLALKIPVPVVNTVNLPMLDDIVL